MAGIVVCSGNSKIFLNVDIIGNSAGAESNNVITLVYNKLKKRDSKYTQ